MTDTDMTASAAEKIKELAYEMSRQDVAAVLSDTGVRRQTYQYAKETAREFEQAVDELAALASRQAVPETPNLLQLARDVFKRLDEGDGNAPGHGHSRIGVWDDDNGARAGTPCQWCALWKQFGEACSASLPVAPQAVPETLTDGIALQTIMRAYDCYPAVGVGGRKYFEHCVRAALAQSAPQACRDAERYRKWRDEYVRQDDDLTQARGLLLTLADAWTASDVDEAIDRALATSATPAPNAALQEPKT